MGGGPAHEAYLVAVGSRGVRLRGALSHTASRVRHKIFSRRFARGARSAKVQNRRWYETAEGNEAKARKEIDVRMPGLVSPRASRDDHGQRRGQARYRPFTDPVGRGEIANAARLDAELVRAPDVVRPGDCRVDG